MNKLLSKSKGQRSSNGFTLVELVVVVAVIGVLGAVAAPKLLGVGESARQAQLDTMAASLSSATASNYSKRAAGGAAAGGSVVLTCLHVASLFGADEGLLDSALYQLTPADSGSSATPDQITNGGISDCVLYSVEEPYLQSTFMAYGTGDEVADWAGSADAIALCTAVGTDPTATTTYGSVTYDKDGVSGSCL